jgi:hypothetical protein
MPGTCVHTVISCSILECINLSADIDSNLKHSHLLKIWYLAAEFFYRKRRKRKEGHSHTGRQALAYWVRCENEREAAYAYGFLSLLLLMWWPTTILCLNLYTGLSCRKSLPFYIWAVADNFYRFIYINMAADVYQAVNLSVTRMSRRQYWQTAAGSSKKHIFKHL